VWVFECYSFQFVGLFERSRKQGDTVKFRLAHRRVYGVHHPDLVKQVLLKDCENFVKRGIYSRLRCLVQMYLIST